MQKNVGQMTASEIIAIFQPPKPRQKWTDDLVAQARRMRWNGAPDRVIAKKLGVTPTDVALKLGLADAALNKQRARQSKASRSFWREEGHTEALIADWNSGHSSGVIAAKLGIDRRAVLEKAWRLRRSGVSMRSGRGSVTLIKPAEVDRALIEKWNAGYSSGTLAVELKTTRNAILGMVKRIRDSGVFMRSSPPLVSVTLKSRNRRTT